jgi:hypothetical protein
MTPDEAVKDDSAAENGEQLPNVDAEAVEQRDPEAFVTESPFIELLAPGGKARILLALIRVRGEKLNPSAICDRAAIDRDTWYEHRDRLVERYQVIEEAGHAGNSPLYRVDMDDPIVKRLSEVYDLAAERRNRVTDPDR